MWNTLIIALLFFAMFCLGKDRKNVLFLMADDFNHWIKDIGYYPQAHTPNLDALASRGVLFSDAYCSSPVCNPSRNALWSGLRPSTTGISSNQGGYVRDVAGFDNVVTMNQHFVQQGYYVFGSGKLYHPARMGSHETDPQNWTALNTGGSGCDGGAYYKWEHKDSPTKWSAGIFNLNASGDTQLALKVADLLEKYPASPHKDKPFFIACGVFRPHLPWNTHKDFYDLFDPDTLVIPQGHKEADGNATAEHRAIVNSGVWKDGIRAYLANMAYADYNIGIMLDALENSPYKDNTIVCFMGDHGWHLGEKQRWRKFAMWDQANRTTLMIYDPSAEGNGKICKKVVSLQDIYPTLMALTGVDVNENAEGADLSPLLENPERDDWTKPVLATYSGTNYIKTNQWKYVDDGGQSMLYHVVEDPHEWNNLYGKAGYATVVATLKAQIDSMVQIGQDIKINLQGRKPEINFISPEAEFRYAEGASIDVLIDASVDGSHITRVSLFIDNTLVSALSTAPFEWKGEAYEALKNLPMGVYRLRVLAETNKGKQDESERLVMVGNVSLDLPEPYQSHDIGSPGTEGQAIYLPDSSAFMIRGAGADIWGTYDQFHFVSQPIDTDAEIIACVKSLDETHAWAKAGVMIRESIVGSARHASMFFTPAQGISFQYRTHQSGVTEQLTPENNHVMPCWLKITRVGDEFAGHASEDGVTWTCLGTATIDMRSRAYFGLAVTSHDDSQLANALFGDVALNTFTHVADSKQGPETFSLHQNYPNPFNPATHLRWYLPIESKVLLEVFDTQGRLVHRMVNRHLKAGEHQIVFDSNDLASGIYFYRLLADGMHQTFSEMRKMVLAR